MSHRKARLGHLIQREITGLIQRGRLKDPRIAELTTITGVEVAKDLSHARVYFTVMGDQAAIEGTRAGLEAGRGFIQRHLAKVLTIRSIPALVFEYDASIAQGDRITRLLAGLPELQAGAAGADAGNEAAAGTEAGRTAPDEAEGNPEGDEGDEDGDPVA